MSILFADNFSQYGTSAAYPLEGVWAQFSGSIVTDPDGVSTGRVAKITETATQYNRKVVGVGVATIGVAFRIYLASLPTASVNSPNILILSDILNVAHVSLWVNPSGYISAYRGASSGTTLLGTTSTPVITAGNWKHIEAKVFISDTVGTIEVRVNEVVVLNITGADTKNSANAEVTNVAADNFTLTGTHVSESVNFKDLVIWDTTGSQNNNFIGDCRVVTLLADTDVSLNWTCSIGTDGGNLIDETTPDDADYIYAVSPPPAAFVSELTNLPADITTVKALLTFVRMYKTDAGSATVQTSLRSVAADDPGAAYPIAVDPAYYVDVSELDPNTATAWTPTTTNAARLVINRTV